MKSATATKQKGGKDVKPAKPSKGTPAGKQGTRAKRLAEKHKRLDGTGKDAAAKKAVKKQEPAKPNLWQRAVQFLREVVSELRKVVWPSRKETIATTSVVLVVALIAGVYLGLVDVVLSRLMRLVIG